jgi:CBS domain containing-hemolysin-like protein
MQVVLEDLAYWWAELVRLVSFDPARLWETEMMVRIAIQVVLLVGSAFFSGSETALFSLSRLDLQNLRRRRHPRSEVLHALLDEPRRLIISILCGNELVNVAAAANLAGILAHLYGEGPRAATIAIVIMVPLLLLLGEVTPKTIAVSDPVRISAHVVAPRMDLWVRVISPMRWLIRGVADRITSMIVGPEKAKENILQVDEFRSLVADVAEEGVLDATERALIYNLLEAGDTEIVEIMTPRTQTKFIHLDMPMVEVVERFRQWQHPRVPVYQDHRDNLVGFVHAEDIMRLVLDETDLDRLSLHDIIHPPVVVPLTKKVDEMFDFFQDNRARAAAVLNEFGGVEGFVTMKDVLTFIFGEISGKVAGQELYRERDENIYEVPGAMKLADFNNLTNFGIDDPRMTTIGGVAFRHLDRLPREGDQVVVEGCTLTVLEMDGHRITRVRVGRGAGGDDDEDQETGPGTETAAEELADADRDDQEVAS